MSCKGSKYKSDASTDTISDLNPQIAIDEWHNSITKYLHLPTSQSIHVSKEFIIDELQFTKHRAPGHYRLVIV